MDKGRQIAVQGRIQTGSYKDRDGKTVYTTDIIIDNDEFLGSGEQRQTAREIEKEASDLFGLGSFDSTSDGIPF
jgi:single-strand DNA-binding protein